MANRKNSRKSTRTTTPEPFAASDDQFAVDVLAKVLTGELLAAGRSLVDNDDKDDNSICMMRGLIAMYKVHERSQQPQVDAGIQYLDPTTSA
jgi:hypothetical protein